MTRSIGSAALAVVLLLGASAFAQEPLPLERAIAVALESHPSIEVASAGLDQAGSGIGIARSGLYPRISTGVSYTRSDNPVFAFSSLLNQRRFSQADFDVQRLNHPGALQNFQSAIRIEQTLFDAGRTKQAIQAARTERELSTEAKRGAEANIILHATRTYFGVAVTAEALAVAEQAAESTRSDLKRAQSLFDAGLATRADVLSVQAHLSAVEEQRIRASNDLHTAEAALNDALGLDLDRQHTLTTALTAPEAPASTLNEYLRIAVENRSDLRQAALGGDLAEARRKQSESARWPRIAGFGSVQADTDRFVVGGAGSWFAGASMQWDIWKGSENRARIAAARSAEAKAAAARRQALSAALLQVRKTHGQLVSAGERVQATEAAIVRAEESRRIVANRYEAGLENVTELLRGETTLTEARFRRLAALYEQRTSRAALDHSAGILTPSSEALR